MLLVSPLVEVVVPLMFSVIKSSRASKLVFLFDFFSSMFFYICINIIKISNETSMLSLHTKTRQNVNRVYLAFKFRKGVEENM